MTPFAKRIELEALVTEREKMLALNRLRDVAGEEQAYTSDDFDSLASRIRALAEPDRHCTVGGCENSPDECDRCAANVTPEAPRSREEEDLRKRLETAETRVELALSVLDRNEQHIAQSVFRTLYNALHAEVTDGQDDRPCGCEEAEELKRKLELSHQALRDRERRELEALAELDEARAEVEVHKADSLRLQHNMADTQIEIARLKHELEYSESTCRAVTERCGQLEQLLEAHDLGEVADGLTVAELHHEVERLKQELSTAREQLPAWARPFTRSGVEGPRRCTLADCPARLCVAWRALSADQRRQCEKT